MRLFFYKIDPEFFDDCMKGRKNFEVRKDDRRPAPVEGDVAIFGEFKRETVSGFTGHFPGSFTGRRMLAGIGFVLRGEKAEKYGVKPGYCVFGLRRANLPQLQFAMKHSAAVMPEGLSKKIKPEEKLEVPEP